MDRADLSLTAGRPTWDFGAVEMSLRDNLDALLYLLFVAGLGVLLVCAGVVKWSLNSMAARWKSPRP